MPLQRVVVAATGETAYVTEEDARAGIASGAYRPVGQQLATTEAGEQYAVEAGSDLAGRGLEVAGAEEVADLAQAEADAELYGGVAGAAKAFYQGAQDSLFLGAPSALAGEEQRRDIARLRRKQGAAYQGGRLVTDVATGIAGASKGALGAAARVLPGGAVARASERLVAGGAAGSRALGVVAGGALEGAAGAAADYLADQVLQEKPGLSGEAFAQQLGVGALLGGAVGGALGGIGAAMESRGARRGAQQLGGLGAADETLDAVGAERAAMAAVDDLLGASERIPLAALVPPRAASPEGVAERVSGIYGALRKADSERIALQAEIDDAIVPGLDLLPADQAAAVRAELAGATRAYKGALADAKDWARGIGREQRAMTRARLDEERVRQAQARTRAAEETAAQRVERERLRTERVAAGPARRRGAGEAEAPPTAIPEAAPGDDLLAQLQRTQEQVSAGRSLREVGEEAAAAAPKRARRGRQPAMPGGFKADGSPRRIKGIPDVPNLDEDAMYVVKAADLRARAGAGMAESVDAARQASIRRGWKEGHKFEPLDVTIYQDGRIEVDQGRARLLAAVEEGRDIPVRFVRGVQKPVLRGKEAVAEFLAAYKRPGVRYEASIGGKARPRPGAVDRVVTFDGPPPDDLPPPLDLSEFRRAEPGEVAERLAAMRARDDDLDRLAFEAREQAAAEAARQAKPAGVAESRTVEAPAPPLPSGGPAEAAEQAVELEMSEGARQVGRVLEGDTDDAVEVFARLDEAAEQMRRVVQRAKAGQSAAQAQGAVSLPDVPEAAAQGLGARIAGRVQDIGTGLEAASALGLPVPSAQQIPIVGDALSAYLRARAAWRALRGTSGTVAATPAARAAAARVRAEQAARAAVAKVLALGEGALTSSVLPGMAGRQAGRLATALRGSGAEQEEMRAEVARVQAADPGMLGVDIARAAVGTPLEVTLSAQEATARAVTYLQEVAPRDPGEGTPWALRTEYAPLEVAQWKQRSGAVRDPAAAAEALAAGAHAPWAKEALTRVWPELWALWREEVARQQDALASLARPQRLAIGANFDVPLDPSQIPGYPRGMSAPAQPASPVRAQPSSRPRAADIMATEEQAEAWE